MTRPAILLDSSCDLDFLQADELGIDLLIQTVNFAGEVLLDMADLDPATFFAMLDAGTPPPTVARVTVEAYARMLERMLERASQVFAIHPKYYSGEHLAVIQEAADRFGERVTVFQTRAMSSPMTLVAQDAQHLLAHGLSGREVSQRLSELETSTRTTMYLDDASYMRRSGTLNELLSSVPEGSRPLLGFPGRELQYLGAATTQATGYRMLLERFQRDLTRVGPGARIATAFSPGGESVAQELEQAARRAGVTQLISVPMGLVQAGLVGPGSLSYAVAPPLIGTP